ncbi:MAG: DNA-binding protein [Spirochaetota bacterium]|nr:MAG: DNA-binding protein [Spirochaetota bacterium]
MRYSQAELGRVFILKLESGEIIHETIENFAEQHHIKAGVVLIVGGGGGEDSTLVVGPEDSKARPITVMERSLDDAHEITGFGTLFMSDEEKSVLHMHISAGRAGASTTGCIRRGVKVWGMLEVIILEITNTKASKQYVKDMNNFVLFTN